MKLLLKAASYIFHPLWMPFAGSLLYFMVTPRFFPQGVIQAKLLAIAIMTIFIPIVFFFLLKTLKRVTDHFLMEIKERKWPLLFYAGINFIILKFVLDSFNYPELYYFFFGIFLSSLLALLLVFFQVKSSLHMAALAGVTSFVIFISYHFQLDLINTISFLLAVTGLTASSRLHYKAHSTTELLAGLIAGALPQIILGIFWL
jgi:hypothetical protein